MTTEDFCRIPGTKVKLSLLQSAKGINGACAHAAEQENYYDVSMSEACG